MNEPEERLDEFDQNEWLDIARSIRPDVSDEQHLKDLQEFLALKKSKSLQ